MPENAPALPETAFYEDRRDCNRGFGAGSRGIHLLRLERQRMPRWKTAAFRCLPGAVVLTGSFEKIPEPVKTYEVIYKYEGKVPEKAPELPKTLSYEEGELVKTAEEPALEGYRFSGWKADNLETEDGAFRMPAETVTLRGSFEKIKPAATAAPLKSPFRSAVRAFTPPLPGPEIPPAICLRRSAPWQRRECPASQC